MEIKNFIKIYDDVLPLSVISNLIRYSKKSEFSKTRVGSADGGKIDFNVRRTFTLALNNLDNSLTSVHWFNFLGNFFTEKFYQYKRELNIIDATIKQISNIEILKYEDTGFYTWHVDHFPEIPRTISFILMLNNDYEGGNLCFRNPDGSGEWVVEVKPNRLILWPSVFLYPHTVKPVTKGTRYTIVAWAL